LLRKKRDGFVGRPKIAVGVSGTGTTFEAIARAVKNKSLGVDLDFLFCDRDCAAEQKAVRYSIPVFKKKRGEHQDDFNLRLIKKIKKEGINIVVLAGYLRLFPIAEKDDFVVINSHPGAIPEFGGPGCYGERVHALVLDFARETEFKHPYTYSTIHIASEVYDEGRILGLKKMSINASDNPTKIAKRLLPKEHENYLDVLQRFACGEVLYFENPKDLVERSDRGKLEMLKTKITKQ
jgi:folate-dependent phosphoribosylglycinamide formyltransferase PurN